VSVSVLALTVCVCVCVLVDCVRVSDCVSKMRVHVQGVMTFTTTGGTAKRFSRMRLQAVRTHTYAHTQTQTRMDPLTHTCMCARARARCTHTIGLESASGRAHALSSLPLCCALCFSLLSECKRLTRCRCLRACMCVCVLCVCVVCVCVCVRARARACVRAAGAADCDDAVDDGGKAVNHVLGRLPRAPQNASRRHV
jgi:hypothetical protein